MDLANLRAMLTATQYCIKHLFTFYVNSDVTPAYSFPKYNAKAKSAQYQTPP
jgi:hypothetical protein